MSTVDEILARAQDLADEARVSRAVILAVAAYLAEHPRASSRAVADALGITGRTARRALAALNGAVLTASWGGHQDRGEDTRTAGEGHQDREADTRTAPANPQERETERETAPEAPGTEDTMTAVADDPTPTIRKPFRDDPYNRVAAETLGRWPTTQSEYALWGMVRKRVRDEYRASPEEMRVRAARYLRARGRCASIRDLMAAWHHLALPDGAETSGEAALYAHLRDPFPGIPKEA